MNKELDLIIRELSRYHSHVDNVAMEELVEAIVSARHVFIAGLGRSGFAARGFSNRLMHLGKKTYFVGEPTTPAIQKDDLLIVGSGSGTTGSLVAMSQKCKQIGAELATLTMFPKESIGRLADIVVVIPGSTPKKSPNDVETAHSLQPMGTLFEQLSWLTYDALILMLMPRLGQTGETMFARHANLE
ncbi:MAG: 6-phospho-3-hexuloisomerase [Bifidobacteriales bacterium]|nr:6-phospho-3-hexuloisomerase [Bifidobacteriales bacterium]